MSFQAGVTGHVARRAHVDGEQRDGARSILMAATALRWAGMAFVAAMSGLSVAAVCFALALCGAAPARALAFWAWAAMAIALCYALFRVRIDAPDGVKASKRGEPTLWRVVEDICAAAGTAPPAGIFIVDDANASSAIVPRARWRGDAENYLVLGLPLLIALTPAQARAVIAHEVGHLAMAHGKSVVAIRKTLAIFDMIAARAQETGNLTLQLLSRFYDFAGAPFAAAANRLSRAHEFAADRVAGDIAGCVAAAEALIAMALVEQLIGERVCLLSQERQLIETRQPADMGSPLVSILTQTGAAQCSHPALAERLAALGVGARAPAPAGPDHAAAAWIENLDALVAQFDSDRRRWIAARQGFADSPACPDESADMAIPAPARIAMAQPAF